MFQNVILNAYFFLRPLSFIQTNFSFFSFNLFEIIAILFIIIIFILGVYNLLSKQIYSFSLLEFLFIFFVLWCIFIFFLNYEKSNISSLIKYIFPPISFIIIKRSFVDNSHLIHYSKWLLIGFIIPLFLSFIFVITGIGSYIEVYSTGLLRYSGVYGGVHSLAHNIAFFIMLIFIYKSLLKLYHNNSKRNLFDFSINTIFLICIFTSLYCLFKAHVRTVYVGLFIFFFISLFLLNRKLFISFIFSFLALIIIFSPIFYVIFFDVIDVYEGKRDINKAGSGRPYIWKHNVEIFSNLSINQQIAGIGIKQIGHDSGFDFDRDTQVWNSHNDYLETLIRTGIVGLFLQLCILLVLFFYAFATPHPLRCFLLAFLISVFFMNLLSNSYISRFGLAQYFVYVALIIEKTSNNFKINIFNKNLTTK